MRAMLHYALLKSVREQSLWAFLFAPMMLVAAPLLGIATEAAISGRKAWPVLLPGMGLIASGRSYVAAATASAVAAAAAAAFWCFRGDIANRSLSFMLLALRRPLTAPLAAVLFGWCAGMIAFVTLIPIVGLAVGTVTGEWIAAALVALLGGFAAAAMGAAFAAYAPVPGTLALVTGVAVIVSAAVTMAIEAALLPAIAGVLASAAALIAFAARGMEKRCAA